MSKRWKTILGYALGLTLLVYLFATLQFDWNKLAHLSWFDFIWLSILSIFLLCLNGWALSPQLTLFGLSIPKKEAFFIPQFYGLLNYLPLKAGLIGEGIQLNLRYGLPYRKYISANILVYAINFFLYALIALILFIFFPFNSIFPFAKPVYFLVFLAVIVLGVLIYIFLPRQIASHKVFAFFFEDREKIWAGRKHVLTLTIITALSLIFTALRLFLVFRIFGYDMSVASALVMSILANLAFLFGLTPGGLGIRETFMGVLSFFIFQDISVGVVISMITRIFDFVWGAVFGAYAFHFLNQVNFFQKNENSQG